MKRVKLFIYNNDNLLRVIRNVTNIRKNDNIINVGFDDKGIICETLFDNKLNIFRFIVEEDGKFYKLKDYLLKERESYNATKSKLRRETIKGFAQSILEKDLERNSTSEIILGDCQEKIMDSCKGTEDNLSLKYLTLKNHFGFIDAKLKYSEKKIEDLIKCNSYFKQLSTDLEKENNDLKQRNVLLNSFDLEKHIKKHQELERRNEEVITANHQFLETISDLERKKKELEIANNHLIKVNSKNNLKNIEEKNEKLNKKLDEVIKVNAELNQKVCTLETSCPGKGMTPFEGTIENKHFNCTSIPEGSTVMDLHREHEKLKKSYKSLEGHVSDLLYEIDKYKKDKNKVIITEDDLVILYNCFFRLEQHEVNNKEAVFLKKFKELIKKLQDAKL
jgi:hypothetical protein